jgi:hypothetical protein
LVLLFGLVGCQRLLGFDELAPNDATTEPDRPTDGEPCSSFSIFVDTCTQPGSGILNLSRPLTFDTDTGTLVRDETQTDVAVTTVVMTTPVGPIRAIVADSVVMDDTVSMQAFGSLPFAIVATTSITIDNNARLRVIAGSRANCPNGAGAGQAKAGGGAGGAGGGFGGVGGAGGPGDADGGASSSGGMGGAAVPRPLGPLGGCEGGKGGDSDINFGGLGGVGGGAILLSAGQRIEISPGVEINAGGGGGGGGAQQGATFGDAGGGGGGSGGMIVLEAPAVACAGILAANGGGGGEGSGGSMFGMLGQSGSGSSTRAPGGSGLAQTGSDGGSGGARDDTTGASVSTLQNGGGGGGGGAAGFVQLVGVTIDLENAVISPDPG